MIPIQSLPANQKDKEECDVIIMQNIEVYQIDMFFCFFKSKRGMNLFYF